MTLHRLQQLNKPHLHIRAPIREFWLALWPNYIFDDVKHSLSSVIIAFSSQSTEPKTVNIQIHNSGEIQRWHVRTNLHWRGKTMQFVDKRKNTRVASKVLTAQRKSFRAPQKRQNTNSEVCIQITRLQY